MQSGSNIDNTNCWAQRPVYKTSSAQASLTTIWPPYSITTPVFFLNSPR